jgi:1-phosphofructokinase family hexose kinase
MILCVTLNPCLDKTLIVPAWQPGDSVRGRSIRQVVGGKGNNVSRALARFGRATRPVTFLGGPVGVLCERLLRLEDRLDPVVINTASTTRVILTVRTETSDEQSAFFDPDPAITRKEAETLIQTVERLLGETPIDALTLSGSSPCPETHGLYSDLIALARSTQTPVFLDTYGPALDDIWGFWPTAIQLNRREACGHLRNPDATEADLFKLLESWDRHGVACGTITDGPNHVLIRLRGHSYRALPPLIRAVNPIGSGDCLLAGLVDAWLREFDPEALIRHAIASAVANALVWDAGAIDPVEVEHQSRGVIIEPLSQRKA